MDPGVFRVDVDYERVRPHVDFGMLDDLDSVFGNYFSQNIPIFSTPQHVYYLYLVTRPGCSPSYVMRLPTFLKSMDLPNLSLGIQWLTFSTVSVVVLSMETSGTPEQVAACARDLVDWLKRVASYSSLLELSDAVPNVATVSCSKDQPLLQSMAYMDAHGMPNWRVPLCLFDGDDTFVFHADVECDATPVACLPVPLDVRYVLANLHVHSLHSIFPHVDRMHFEKRPPTPTRVASAPVSLQDGDVIVYLGGDNTCLCFARVVATNVQRSYWLQLHNAEEPQCFAKFNTADQVLESPLQLLDAFVPH